MKKLKPDFTQFHLFITELTFYMNFKHFSPRSIVVKNIVSSPVHKMKYHIEQNYNIYTTTEQWLNWAKSHSLFTRIWPLQNHTNVINMKLKPYVQSWIISFPGDRRAHAIMPYMCITGQKTWNSFWKMMEGGHKIIYIQLGFFNWLNKVCSVRSAKSCPHMQDKKY